MSALVAKWELCRRNPRTWERATGSSIIMLTERFALVVEFYNVVNLELVTPVAECRRRRVVHRLNAFKTKMHWRS